RKKIEPLKNEIPKYKWLATIVRDVPVEFDYPPYVLTLDRLREAQQLFEWLEFRQHSRRLPIVLRSYVSEEQGGLFGAEVNSDQP
ncbi:MAG: hypothetical protein C4342_01400, partial [Armatimonadota bacterium]